jgi:hypothetical protein
MKSTNTNSIILNTLILCQIVSLNASAYDSSINFFPPSQSSLSPSQSTFIIDMLPKLILEPRNEKALKSPKYTKVLQGILNELMSNKEPLLGMLERLKLDQRPVAAGLFDLPYAGYLSALKEIVNPGNKSLLAIYGAMGADISSILYATNATTIVGVDTTSMDIKEFKNWLKKYNDFEVTAKATKSVPTRRNQGQQISSEELHEKLSLYFFTKRTTGGAMSYESDMPLAEVKILAELRALEVEKKSISIHEENGALKLSFDWAYKNDKPKKREIVFIVADLLNTRLYPALLNDLLKGGIDVYFQKAAFNLPSRYSDYLPTFASALRHGGYLMTADTALMKPGSSDRKDFRKFNPDALLAKLLMPYEAITKAGDITSQPMERYAFLQGTDKPGLDAKNAIAVMPYWWQVELRRKGNFFADRNEVEDMTNLMRLSVSTSSAMELVNGLNQISIRLQSLKFGQKDHFAMMIELFKTVFLYENFGEIKVEPFEQVHQLVIELGPCDTLGNCQGSDCDNAGLEQNLKALFQMLDLRAQEVKGKPTATSSR